MELYPKNPENGGQIKKRPVVENILFKGENPTLYNSLEDIYNSHKKLLKDFVYTLVQRYGNEVEELVTKKRDQIFNIWFDKNRIYLPTDEVTRSRIETIKDNYISNGHFNQMITDFTILLFPTPLMNNSNLQFDEFRNQYHNYTKNEINKFNDELGCTLYETISKTYSYGTVQDVYSDVVILEDEEIGFTKIFPMITSVFSGLDSFEGLRGNQEADRRFNFTITIKNSENNGLSRLLKFEAKTNSDVFNTILPIILSLIYTKPVVASVSTKIIEKGVSYSQSEDGKIIFNIASNTVKNDLGIDFTEKEMLLIEASSYISADGEFTITGHNSIMDPIKESDKASILFAYIKHIHRYIWVNQRIQKEQSDLPGTAEASKKFKKEKVDLYRFYESLYDEYFLKEDLPIPKNVENSNESSYLKDQPTLPRYTPYKAPEAEVAILKNSEKIINIKTIKERLIEYGNFIEKIDSFEISDSQLRFIDSVLDYIDEYIRTGNNVNSLYLSIPHAMYMTNELLPRKYETEKVMEIGKTLHNAIKINLNRGKRMVIYTENDKVLIKILSRSDYHDNRGTRNG